MPLGSTWWFGYVAAWLSPVFVGSYLCKISCAGSNTDLFSVSNTIICVHIPARLNVKSLLVGLAQPLPIAEVYLLSLSPSDEKQTLCLWGEEKNKAKRSNPHSEFKQAGQAQAGVLSPEAWLKLCCTTLEHWLLCLGSPFWSVLACLPPPPYHSNNQAVLYLLVPPTIC